MNIPNRHIKIANPSDFDGHPKYIVVQESSPIAHLQKGIFSLKYQEVNIFHVEIINNRTVNPNDNGMYKTGFVGGAILGGVLGAMLASKIDPIKWDIDLRILLHDGRYINTTIKDEVTVRILEPYMNVSEWDIHNFYTNLKKQKLAYNRQMRDVWELEEQKKRIEWQKQLDIKQEQMKKAEQERVINEKVKNEKAELEFNEKLTNIKNNIEEFLEICESIDIILWKVDPNQEFSARQMIIYHLIAFCIYLCTSINNITKTDVKIINSLFDEKYNTEILESFAIKQNINKNHFGSTIPKLFPFIISIEAPEFNIKCCNNFIDIHRFLVEEFMLLTDRTDEFTYGMSYVKKLELYKNTVSYEQLNNPNNTNTSTVHKESDDEQLLRLLKYDHSNYSHNVNLPEYKRGTKIFHEKYGNGVIVSQINYKIVILFLDDRTIKFDISKSDEKELIKLLTICNSNIIEELEQKYYKYMKSKTLSSDAQPIELQIGPEEFMTYSDYLYSSDCE